MEQQLIQVTQNEVSPKQKQYSEDDMLHIAELYQNYYLIVNNHGNVLSPKRVQINKKHWTDLTLQYNLRQDALPYGEGVLRTEKALNDKWLLMRTKYQAKKDIIKSTGSGGGPISGYLKKMHEFLHDDPLFYPKATYSSLKRQYVIRDDEDDEEHQCVDLSFEGHSTSTSSSSASSSFSQKEKKQKKSRMSIQEEREVARLKERDEALDRMQSITENMTRELKEIMSKPLVVQHVDSDEKKEFYKKFLELMEKGLN